MSQLDRHQTTEQLSAFLDKQLSSDEESQTQAHVDTCSLCQQELAELRQTVTLLRALPTPALPRSFALPETLTQLPATPSRQVATMTTQDQPQPIAIAAQRQQRQRQGRTLRTTMRLLSGLAAVIGIFFVLSGLLTGIPFLSTTGVNSTPTMGGQANGLDPNSKTIAPHVTTTSNNTTGRQIPPPISLQPTATSGATTKPAQSPALQPASKTSPVVTPQSQSQAFPVILFFDMNSQGGRLGLGIVFFIIGSCGVMYFSRRRAGPIVARE